MATAPLIHLSSLLIVPVLPLKQLLVIHCPTRLVYIAGTTPPTLPMERTPAKHLPVPPIDVVPALVSAALQATLTKVKV